MKFWKSLGLGFLAWFIALTIFANVNHNYAQLIEHILSMCVGIVVLLSLLLFVPNKKDVEEHGEDQVIIDTDKNTIEDEKEKD